MFLPINVILDLSGFPRPPPSHSSTRLLFVPALLTLLGISKNDDLSRCFRFYYVNPVQTDISLKGTLTRRAKGRFGFRSTKRKTEFGFRATRVDRVRAEFHQYVFTNN